MKSKKKQDKQNMRSIKKQGCTELDQQIRSDVFIAKRRTMMKKKKHKYGFDNEISKTNYKFCKVKVTNQDKQKKRSTKKQ